MENAPSNNEASSGTSALDDGLERQRFQELCDLLPVDVNWFDPITPQIVREIVIAIEEREREACAKACEAELIGTGKHDHETDRAYDRALNDAAKAIRMRSNVELTGAARHERKTKP